MRSLGEIVEDTLGGVEVPSDEAMYTIAALDKLLTFARMDFSSIARKDEKFFRYYEEHFNRMKRVLNQDPKEWLGPDYDPLNPEYRKRRAQAEQLAKSLIEKNKD